MIDQFQTSGICSSLDIMELSVSIKTKGKKYKFIQHHCHYDLRKYQQIMTSQISFSHI